MALPASDAFAGSGALNSTNWTEYSAGWSTLSGVAEATAGIPSMAFWKLDAFANDQYAQVTMGTLDVGTDTGSGPAVRCLADGSCIFAQTSTTETRLYQRSGASTYTQLGSTITDATRIQSADTCYIQVVGTTVTVKKGGSGGSTVISASTQAGAPTTGAGGMWGSKTTNDMTVDNFAAGNTGSTQSQAPRSMHQFRQRRVL